MTRASILRMAVAAGLLLSLGVTAGSGQAAAPKKVFHESLSVATTAGTAVTGALAASTPYDFAFMLTNDAHSPQAFGSAKIVTPTGFSLGAMSTNVSTFHAADSGGNVLVTSTGPTGSGIAPGSSLTVTVRVTTPATGACNAAWPTFVKQSNDFSGSGNDFQPADPAPGTTTGGGSLTITRQPTTTQWNTAMAPGPILSVVDPCGVAVGSFTGELTVTDGLGLLSTGSVATAVAGAATFSNLTFSDYGVTDTLTATTPGYASVTTDAFDIVQSLVPCVAGTPCNSGTLGDKNGTTLASVNANAGPSADHLSTTVKGTNAPGLFPACDASGEPPLGAVVTFAVTTRSKTVTMTLPKVYVNQIPNNGAPFMDICLDVPVGQEFVDKFGNTTTTGLLPDCTTKRTVTCVSSRGKNAGNEVITFKLPAGDPHSSWF
ncbi:MAG: hypothetical protein QOG34_1048 [Frankiaceae bacterium]|nr:hypothetical protein [Frankiaceae bacterium]